LATISSRVHLERAAVAVLVEEGEHERRHRLAVDALRRGRGQRFLDQRLDLDAVVGIARE